MATPFAGDICPGAFIFGDSNAPHAIIDNDDSGNGIYFYWGKSVSRPIFRRFARAHFSDGGRLLSHVELCTTNSKKQKNQIYKF